RRLGRRSPLLTWQFIVFRFNEHEIERAKAMAVEFGVDRITFRPPFLDAERFGLADAGKHEIRSWSPTDARYQVHVGDPVRRSRCGWHYTTVAINWDGTVTPCSTSFRQADDFGSFSRAGEHDFKDVINNDRFRSARKSLLEGKSDGEVICERCPTPSIQT